MGKFRKKPVEVEALQWTGYNLDEVREFVSDGSFHGLESDNNGAWRTIGIKTLEGVMLADRNDWIIKGVKGEFYPCKPDIFEQTYEAVEV